MFRNKKEHDEIVREMDLEKKCHPCTFLEHAGNHGDPNIVDISSSLSTFCLSVFILNSQYEEGARDVSNILAPEISHLSTSMTHLIWAILNLITIYFSLRFKRYK